MPGALAEAGEPVMTRLSAGLCHPWSVAEDGEGPHQRWRESYLRVCWGVVPACTCVCGERGSKSHHVLTMSHRISCCSSADVFRQVWGFWMIFEKRIK